MPNIRIILKTNNRKKTERQADFLGTNVPFYLENPDSISYNIRVAHNKQLKNLMFRRI